MLQFPNEVNDVQILRLQREMSQADLADLVGCSRTQMSFIETGRELPTAEQLHKLQAIFDVPRTHLFGKEALALILKGGG